MQCKEIGLTTGKRCKYNAMIGKYCTIHYKMRGKENGRTNRKKDSVIN